MSIEITTSGEFRAGEIRSYRHALVYKAHTGDEYPMGCLPTCQALMAALPTYTQAGYPLVAEKEWTSVDDGPDNATIPIKNQGSVPGCTHWALNRVGECARYASHQPYIELAPEFSYYITTGGLNVGTNIGNAIEFAEKYGLAPRSDIPKGTRLPTTLKAKGSKSALRFRFRRTCAITTKQEWVSAILHRHAVEFSVTVGVAFDSFDADGCVRNGVGMNNHAVMNFARLKITPKGRVCPGLDNSWALTWGDKGRAWVDADQVLNRWGCEIHVVEAVIDDPDNPNPVPIPMAGIGYDGSHLDAYA